MKKIKKTIRNVRNLFLLALNLTSWLAFFVSACLLDSDGIPVELLLGIMFVSGGFGALFLAVNDEWLEQHATFEDWLWARLGLLDEEVSK